MSKELLDALADLRRDPFIQSLLEEGERNDPSSGQQAPSTYSRDTDRTPPPRRQSDSTQLDRQRTRNDQEVGLEPSLFLHRREDQRDSVGTIHWLEHHRDELSQSEKKRLENRLRAENMFALAQLEYDQFVSDVKNRSQHNPASAVKVGGAGRENDAVAPSSTKVAHHADPVEERRPPTPQPHYTKSNSGAPYQATEPAGVQTRGGNVLDHGAGSALPAAALASLGMRPTPTMTDHPSTAPLDSEEEIYRRKLKELTGRSTPIAQSVQRETANGYAEAAMPGSHSPSAAAGANNTQRTESFMAPNSHSPDVGHPDLRPRQTLSSAQAILPSRETSLQRRFDLDYAALVEAVEQRDRTIARLERLLREDKEYYEGQLVQKRNEIVHLQNSTELRIQAMKQEMQTLLHASKKASDMDHHDVREKLSVIEANYLRSAAELRTEFNVLIQNYHNDCDRRMREVTEEAERTMREARDTYSIDYSKALEAERRRLLDRLGKDQENMLREAELQLRTELEKTLFARVKTALEANIRAQLRTELLPLVRSELMSTIKTQLIRYMEDEARVIVAEELSKGGSGGQPSSLRVDQGRPPAATAEHSELLQRLAEKRVEAERLVRETKTEKQLYEQENQERTRTIAELEAALSKVE
jgi:hypothetical protein